MGGERGGAVASRSQTPSACGPTTSKGAAPGRADLARGVRGASEERSRSSRGLWRSAHRSSSSRTRPSVRTQGQMRVRRRRRAGGVQGARSIARITQGLRAHGKGEECRESELRIYAAGRGGGRRASARSRPARERGPPEEREGRVARHSESALGGGCSPHPHVSTQAGAPAAVALQGP